MTLSEFLGTGGGLVLTKEAYNWLKARSDARKKEKQAFDGSAASMVRSLLDHDVSIAPILQKMVDEANEEKENCQRQLKEFKQESADAMDQMKDKFEERMEQIEAAHMRDIKFLKEENGRLLHKIDEMKQHSVRSNGMH